MQNIIKQLLEDSIYTKKETINNLLPEIEKSAQLMIEAVKNKKKIFVCGNGGSAADAQHFVAELVVRFEKDRKAIPAIALTTNSSNLTAGANDFSYEHVFKRQIEALGEGGDILVGITTSGNSSNIIQAFEIAKQKNMICICLNGNEGGKVNNLNLNSSLIIPSLNTARIQETHITIIHIWCKLIEDVLFND